MTVSWNLARLGIVSCSETEDLAWEDTLALAGQLNLTVYDAAYLELAIHRGLPLATLDRALRQAAGALSIRLLGQAE